MSKPNPKNQDLHWCDNCGSWKQEHQVSEQIQEIHERVYAGDFMPAGQCATCGGLVYSFETLVGHHKLTTWPQLRKALSDCITTLREAEIRIGMENNEGKNATTAWRLSALYTLRQAQEALKAADEEGAT